MFARTSRRQLVAGTIGVLGIQLLAACATSVPPTAPPATQPAKPAAPTAAAPAAAPPTTAAPAATPTAAPAAAAPASAGAVKEATHWYTWTASDGDIWKRALDEYNAKYKSQGLQIKYEFQPGEQYGTKLLGTIQAGSGTPDFGWGQGAGRRDWVKKGAVVALDDTVKSIGFDLSDFTDRALEFSRYDGKLFSIPMELLTFQMEINADAAAAAGLDVGKAPDGGPQSGEEVLSWAEKMTKRDGDKVTRSGFLMTGSGVHINLVWGVVADQMGFRRASDDLKKAAINPDAAKQAAQWVLDLFDKHKVATRDITDRYKAFGTGDGSIFWTGPWTLSGYVTQGLNFVTVLMPQVGKERATPLNQWGLEMYLQKDKTRYETTVQTMKRLSDDSFLWTTVGRGVTARKSILNRPDYRTAGHPWKVRGAFVDGMKIGTMNYVLPVTAVDDFDYYNGTGVVAKSMDPVWAKQRSVDDGIRMLTQQWQQLLDAG